MKLFIETTLYGHMIVRIATDNGSFIAFKGKSCDDLGPIYGCELDDGSEERLKEWINRNTQQPCQITLKTPDKTGLFRHSCLEIDMNDPDFLDKINTHIEIFREVINIEVDKS